MTTDLEGRHALVTGGGTGIGLAIAQMLASRGAKVTITGRRGDVLDNAAAGTPGLHPLVMDVAQEASVVQGIAEAIAARGPVTICVANAGIAEGKSMGKMDMAFWRNMMAINLDGAYLTVRECLGGMLAEGWGRTIFMSSIAGLKGLKGAPAYTASKHGMIGLMRGLSEEYMGSELTFNAICPGYVDTDIVARNTESISARAGIDAEQARAMMVKSNRHKRLITPAEVAAAAEWLVGPNSGSVNGQTLEIAGGQM
ncbi:SDR family NAD(P)-dependent oxidoreductase [Pararhodobacter marinus]|uniref:3-hydroxyacyl-CoA dehydrogenase n=1 Tax=Pararhodobacter marinus TaxID=2184063 RepID=A0A2U2CIE3_9RHOB|nr:SDR family oxidoreductase [Pararhodobacter marinus]PWE31611.1 3-hydroxyacyl-CoA dehydrogenase [Pararhodobacter marinus]